MEEIEGRSLTTGIAVAATETNRGYYIRLRPVVRIIDFSDISISPETIDPKRTTIITVTVTPYIARVAAKSVILTIRGSVITDSRLTLNSNSPVEQTINQGVIKGPDLIFNYSLNHNTANYRPVDFRVTLEYSLGNCIDSYRNPCPVFDSKEGV